MLKIIRVIYILFFCLSTNLYATVHKCNFEGFSININANKTDKISMALIKNSTQVSSCYFEVVSYDDGVNGASTNELIRFKKNNCTIIFDKIAEKITIIDEGFIKTPKNAKKSYIHIVKNQHPLLCDISK